MSFEALLAIAGIAASFVTALLAVIRGFLTAAALRDQRRKLQSLRVAEVVQKADLHSLGNLISVDLGGTSMPNYVRHSEVRASFRDAFNAARDFIGQAPELVTDRFVDSTVQRDSDAREPMGGEEKLTESAQIALRDVAEGESWNALARMRRDLEMILASRLDQTDVEPRRMAASQMLAVAAKQGVIPAESVSSLRYAISVANRGIHGEEISADIAVEAIVMIDRFIRSLQEGPSSSEGGAAR